MRWPIRWQVLTRILLVVVAACVLSSLASAYMVGLWARQRQQENLQRVVSTLTQAGFPLTENVLRQMQGLSGAEFVVLGAAGDIQAATLAVDVSRLRGRGSRKGTQQLGNLASSPALTLNGNRYLANRLPLRRRPPGDADSLWVLYPEKRWWSAAGEAVYLPLAAGGAAVVAAVVVAIALARRFVRPLDSLNAQVAAIADGVFEPMPLPARNDEHRDLAVSVNRMVEHLVGYEEQIRRSERLRTLGQLGAGMAHQLRNCATGARMGLEFHGRTCSAAGEDDSLRVAVDQLSLMESYIERFLKLGRDERNERTAVDPATIVEEAVSLVRPRSEHAGIDLQTSLSSAGICIEADPESLRHLVVNLLLNAVEAATMGDRNPPLVQVGIESTGAERVTISVADSGPGPPPQLADRILEPFVTDKPDGTGLGLAVVHEIATAHGAALRWERAEPMTRFLVEFRVSSRMEHNGAPVDCR